MKLTWSQAYRLIPNLDELLDGGDHGRTKRTLIDAGCPVAIAVQSEPHRWSVTIAAWHPASDNVQRKGHWAWHKVKKRDRAVIKDWLLDYAEVPRAEGPRRLWTHIAKEGRQLDAANCNKSLRDALVFWGLLKDDDARWLEGHEPTTGRAAITATTIILEDIL